MSKRKEQRYDYNPHIPPQFLKSGLMFRCKNLRNEEVPLGDKIKFLIVMEASNQASTKEWRACYASAVTFMRQFCWDMHMVLPKQDEAAIEWLRRAGCYPWETFSTSCPRCGFLQLCADPYHDKERPATS